jgi:cyclic beta-1,2-glucan synthetase
MFVDTECLDGRVLIARHRPRSPGDPQIWAAHLIIGESDSTQFETDRGKFLGRGNSPASPDAMKGDLSGTVGAVLDPIFSLRARLTLDPRDRRQLTFVTMAATSREALMALVAKYEHPDVVSRDFELAWTRAQLRFRYLGIGDAAAQRFQELASYMVYPNPRLRAPESRLSRNRLGQERLWAYGISGDLPILAVVISEPQNLALARELLLAHTYWRIRGFKADLVILNQEAPAYDRPLRNELDAIIAAHSAHTGRDRPGGVFLRDWHAIPEEDRELIFAASSAVLYGGRGSLQQQLMLFAESPSPPSFKPADGTHEEPSQPLPFLELPYFNGLGGFKPDGSEYAIYLKPGAKTPSPWVNVMANENFGSMVSESGLGFTWAGNSQTNRLTPWHNDAVRDPQSEVIYLRDADSGAVWTPTALPIVENDAYRARHGQGFTVYEHNSHSIGQELTVFVPVNDPVKVYRLKLRNDSSRPRRLAVIYFAELVLGTSREEQQLHVQTSWDQQAGALFVRNPWNSVHSGAVAFASSSPTASSYSGDRAEFLGRNGSAAHPAAVDDERLNNRAGAGLDPAAALQLEVKIEPGREIVVVFLLGQSATVEDARTLIGRYRTPEQAEAALTATRDWWAQRLSVINVRTPVLSVDFLVNRWLPYQTLSCRMWGRSALYQSGGAFGFRDQLQDSMALFYAWPELARAHILKSAARQFVEGDAQHWWHPETGSGVRTRCSDDLVWLPYVVARYVEVTGDAAILDETVSFIDGNPLTEGETEKMFTPTVSIQSASLREHCIRALNHASGLGPHGLPLIGNGDWNDGLSLVGVGGKGESVWLAWFLNETLNRFAPLVDSTQAASWKSRATALAKAVELEAWDGEWYLRAFFDSGEPLGSHVCTEAKIDSLPQSWAVISGAGDPARARTAMLSADRLLVKQKEKLVQLFDPPFEHSQPNPGYIMGYPPGVRENGGQYTHGSLWLAMAWARLRDGNAAARTLQLMNPVEHSRDSKGVERYQGEPYVSAADVYFAPGKVGRAGWTWYTGSSGWMYRIWLEEVLGFHLRGEVLTIDPAIPDDWPGYDMTYRHRSATYEIKVVRESGVRTMTTEVDGSLMADGAIKLMDDSRIHRILIRLPRPEIPQRKAANQIAPAVETNGKGPRREAESAEVSPPVQRK